jgi:hypothetical protein
MCPVRLVSHGSKPGTRNGDHTRSRQQQSVLRQGLELSLPLLPRCWRTLHRLRRRILLLLLLPPPVLRLWR